MGITRCLANGAVLFVSLVAGLFVCELAARLVLNPADYVSVTTVRDDVLGIRVAPGAAGFDEWGFRNRRVPTRAEIVAIGDSHTYGNNATLADSWPSVVGRLTGRTVYNLGLGGYGPNQYDHLLHTYALRLRPRWVVCGLYMGDDFENAFRMTYGKDHWAFLRRSHGEAVDADIWERTPHAARWDESVRAWLSRNSVVYRLVVHGPLLGQLKGAVQIRRVPRRGDEATTSISVAEAGIDEAFRPIAIRDRVNQRSPAVREGMRITFELLARMDRTCHQHGCQLVVVIIPTKETVFADQLLGQPRIHLRETIAELVKDEEEARTRVVQFLVQARIPHVDTLSALRRRVADRLYTRSDQDMHPGRNGYRVIGEAVAEFFNAATERP